MLLNKESDKKSGKIILTNKWLFFIYLLLKGGNKVGKSGQNEIDLDLDATNHGVNPSFAAPGENVNSNEVLIMNTKNEDRPTSFFAQPGILAGLYIINYSIYKCH